MSARPSLIATILYEDKLGDRPQFGPHELVLQMVADRR